jgi:hypothetical protein
VSRSRYYPGRRDHDHRPEHAPDPVIDGVIEYEYQRAGIEHWLDLWDVYVKWGRGRGRRRNQALRDYERDVAKELKECLNGLSLIAKIRSPRLCTNDWVTSSTYRFCVACRYYDRNPGNKSACPRCGVN